MPSRVLETVLTGRNLLSPVLTGAARDVEGFDAKVAASQEKASTSATASARAQKTAADQVVAANTRSAASTSESSAKVVAANTRAAESTRAYADVTESSMARAGIAWSSLATKGLPLVAAATAVITGKMAGDYQQLITKLETTAGESQRNLGMVSKGLLGMAGEVGTSADELAKGMYTVESAGFHGRDGLLVEKAAAEGARQETADLGKVTDAVTTILHDYHLKASDAATVTSQLVTAVSHGKTTFDELTGSLHSVTPLAAKLNVPLADVTGTLSAMTASGESADQATQNMADTLRHLANPTSVMTNELAQLGITSTDLADDLSSKGLAGTLQLVEQAIVDHLDPATQRVLLPALNQSKVAAADMTQMIATMPPALAKASQSLLDGKTSIKDYQIAAKDMGGQSGAMALQFLSLMKSSDGFNQALKSGSPAAQAFTAAMSKSFGTASALNVALMTTGENAAATNGAIKDIASTSAQADGNIKGWSEVQGNFNQKLAEAGAEAKTLAIEAGQHLLPVLTSTVGWIGSTGLPAIGHLGSGIGDLVHDFMQLPAPIRDAVLALVALKVITSTDMFAGLIASGRVLAVGFAHDMSNMVASARAGAGSITAAFAEAKAAQQALTMEQFGTSAVSKATGDIAGLGAAASTAARGGLAAMRSAGGSLVDMLGGPWVIAAAAATAGVVALVNSSKAHTAAVKAETDSLLALMKAQEGGGSGAATATDKVDAFKKHISDLQKQIDAATTSAVGSGKQIDLYGGQQQAAGDKVAELRSELAKAKDDLANYHAQLTPLETAQLAVTKAQNDLNDALKHNAPDSVIVADDAGKLHDAQAGLAIATAEANDAQKTQAQRMQEQATAALASIDATRSLQLSQLDLKDAIIQYNQGVADGTLKGDALTRAQLQLQQQAEETAQAAADAAVKQAQQNGATDTAAVSQVAFKQALQTAADQMTGPSRKAIEDIITQTGGAATGSDILASHFEAMGLNVSAAVGQAAVDVADATAAQIKNMQDLGYEVIHLPNGHIVVSADTNPAQAEIQDLLNYARTQSILYRATLPSLVDNSVASGSGRPGAATGGWISGPGTGTSDSVPVNLSHGEFVVNAASASQHADVLEAINGGSRRVGLAAGGWVGLSPDGTWPVGNATIPVHIQDAGYMAGIHNYLQQAAAFAPGAPMAVLGNAAIVQAQAASRGWTGAEWNALYALVMRESGFRNTAANPTSSAYGMFQFLDSTWGAYGGGKTSDPAAQTRMGLDYIGGRYGDPLGAWGHETRYGWYDRGGPLQPGYTLAYNGTGKTEWVNTAEQAASPASMPGYGTPFSGAQFGPTGPINVQVQARVFVGDREITDIVRVEATSVVNGRLTDLLRKSTRR